MNVFTALKGTHFYILSEEHGLYVVVQESVRQVSIPTQHNLNPDDSEFIPVENIELDLVSNEVVLHDNNHQATSDSLVSSSGDATVVKQKVLLVLGVRVNRESLRQCMKPMI